jgi:hypothetical protein
MVILTIGIDLAKNVFAVRGINEAGKSELALAGAQTKRCEFCSMFCR